MTAYDASFYDVIRSGCQASAAVVAPIVYDLLDLAAPRVIDVGCGEGWWAQAFAELGAEVIGLDGTYVQGSPLGDRFIPCDLAEQLPEHLAGRFDLAVCLEVAEHLPARRARGLVDELLGLAPVVLFSAAMPGQGGTGHVNEQTLGYWVDLFTHDAAGEQRAAVSGALRWQIWDNPAVENWYKSNLLLVASHAVSPNVFIEQAMDSPLAPAWQVVHPVLFDARRR